MPLSARDWLKDQRPSKRSRHELDDAGDTIMANYLPLKHLLVPSAFSRKTNDRISGRLHSDVDDFLSPEVEQSLEHSFASTMSIQSPIRDSSSLTSENENPDYSPMDISPAPQRIQTSKSHFLDVKPTVGRPRAYTSSARLFGRDMSNSSVRSNSGLSNTPSASSGTSSGNKKLQRSEIPLEWRMASPHALSSENLYSQASHDFNFDQDNYVFLNTLWLTCFLLAASGCPTISRIL